MSGIQWKVAVLLQRVKSVKLGGDLVPLTNEIIEMIEQDVARRLLSSKGVGPVADEIHAQYLNSDERYSVAQRVARDAMKAALSHIGIEEGA